MKRRQLYVNNQGNYLEHLMKSNLVYLVFAFFFESHVIFGIS